MRGKVSNMFNKIKGKLGFGCMRLPMTGDLVDKETFNDMIDAYMDAGFNYFDTAHGYIAGKSEKAIGECLSERYNREEFVLANKISYWWIKEEKDVIPYFENQLKSCGVEYFDFYLLHSVNREGYEKYIEFNTFNILKKLKEQGKIKHIAISFHDTAELLDMVLKKHPCIEAVQLQINYMDYDDPTVQSKACYDVAVKHGKKVIVMEPVKGGALANLPEEAVALLRKLGTGSQASFALRYAASYPEVFMVLSGMGNIKMMEDNIKTFKNFTPVDEKEIQTFDRIRKILRETNQISCTKCNYCSEVCPFQIPISEMFNIYNNLMGGKESYWDTKEKLEVYRGKIEKCVKCGKCEKNCPQSIKIREYLEKIEKIING